MNRIALTDSSGKWFDMDKATEFKNHYFWDGNNNTSKSAGKYNHESIYRTASGKWVLEFTSQWQGINDSYTELDDEDAAAWFMKNEYSDNELPEELLLLLKKYFNDLEL